MKGDTMEIELEKAMRELGNRMQLLKALQENGEISSLTDRDILILNILAERGRMNVSEIRAIEPGVSESTMSINITKLWHKKLVSKTISPDNQRTTIVELTKAGQKAIEIYNEQRAKRIKMLFNAINVTDEEKNVLIRVFGRATEFFDRQFGLDGSKNTGNKIESKDV
jgi:DNA-binding MarR family transcriptional regulator